MAVARTAHLNCANVTGTTNTQPFDCVSGDTLITPTEDAVNTAGNTTGVTYNGVSLTEIARVGRGTGDRQTCLWGIHNPSTGTNDIVASRTSSSVGRFVVSAFAYSGTDTTTNLASLGAGYVKSSNGTATTTTLTFSNAGNEAICAMGEFQGGSQAASTGATLVSSFDIVSDFEASTLPATANYSMTATMASGEYAFVGVALAESSGTDYPLTASVGAFTLSGIASGLLQGLQMVASAGSFVLTGIASAFVTGKGFVADTATYVLTGTATTFSTTISIIASAGSFTLTGISAVLDATKLIVAGVAEYLLTGQNARLRPSNITKNVSKIVASVTNRSKS